MIVAFPEGHSTHLRDYHRNAWVYREMCKSTRKELKDKFTIEGICQPPGPGSMIPPTSNNIKMHYSFDMAQQVSFTTQVIIHILAYIRCIIHWIRSNRVLYTSYT